MVPAGEVLGVNAYAVTCADEVLAARKMIGYICVYQKIVLKLSFLFLRHQFLGFRNDFGTKFIFKSIEGEIENKDKLFWILVQIESVVEAEGVEFVAVSAEYGHFSLAAQRHR